MAKVICSASHPIDLHNGRTLAPGEVAEDVDTEHPHQRALILDGHLTVQEGVTPRVRKEDALVAAAAETDKKGD